MIPAPIIARSSMHMRKSNSSFHLFVLLSAVIAGMASTNVHAAIHHHVSSSKSVYTSESSVSQEFRSFADMAPKFSGFFGNLGIGYNMHSGSITYTDTFLPAGSFAPNVSASQSASQSNVSGLIKLGYAFRVSERGYLGLAAIYNLAAEQKLMDVAYQYGAGTNPVKINNTVKQGNSLGFVVQPGYLVDMKSLAYLNVGITMDDFKFQTQEVNGADAVPVATNKKPINYIIGLGYQRQLINLPKLRNLTWFTELKFTTSIRR
jgi:hypothetical protein